MARALSAIRRNGGTLIGIPDNFAGAYIDSTGTTPVTAVGDLVGLLTDRSYGAGNLGVERKQDFVTGIDGTATAATYNTATGVGSVTRVDFSNQSSVRITGLTATASYQLSITNTGAVVINVRQTNSGGVIVINIATGSTSSVVFTGNSTCVLTSSGGTSTFVLNSFREVLGNHATQPTPASKPVVTRVPKRLGANLVTNGDFSNGTAGWDPQATATIAVSGGLMEITCTGAGYGTAARTASLVIGKTYWLQASSPDSGVTVRVNNTTVGTPLASLALSANTQSMPYTATESTVAVAMHANSNVAGTKRRFGPIALQEVLEWTNAISFDGSNDFLTTGITTGNEGWVCAGVTLNNSNTSYLFYAGANTNAEAGVTLRSISGELQLLCGDGVARDVSGKVLTIGTPQVLDGGWTPTSMTVAVNGAEATQAKTRNCTGTIPTTLGAAAGSFPTAGAFTVFLRTPVLPSAADRALIRKWVGSLQGQTL
ncbi:MAG: hypothetical protein WBK26_11790 [Burkholderiaceae bacterium]